MAFTSDELKGYYGRPVDDLVGEDCKLLFVGINPGLWTAATNTHFCHPSNRFYPALRLAGIIEWDLDARVGMTPEQRADLVTRGIGITNLVNKATARASELEPGELEEGASRLRSAVAEVSPRVVAVAGLTAYRTAFSDRSARAGRQDVELSGAEVWVVPNPSGLNAHETTASLAEWYGRVYQAAVE